MKKVLIPVILLTIAAYLLYTFYFKKTATVEHHKEIPLTVSANDSLTGNVGLALQSYFNMKDGFVKGDTAMINSHAQEFAGTVQAVALNGIKADASILQLAEQLKQTIGTETNNLVATSGLEAKRKIFQPLSDELFDLLRTIGYNGSSVYQQYCPMAFDNKGAAWLSNSTEIVNPYFGSKMLHCGEVRDSIFIAKK